MACLQNQNNTLSFLIEELCGFKVAHPTAERPLLASKPASQTCFPRVSQSPSLPVLLPVTFPVSSPHLLHPHSCGVKPAI